MRGAHKSCHPCHVQLLLAACSTWHELHAETAAGAVFIPASVAACPVILSVSALSCQGWGAPRARPRRLRSSWVCCTLSRQLFQHWASERWDHRRAMPCSLETCAGGRSRTSLGCVQAFPCPGWGRQHMNDRTGPGDHLGLLHASTTPPGCQSSSEACIAPVLQCSLCLLLLVEAHHHKSLHARHELLGLDAAQSLRAADDDGHSSAASRPHKAQCSTSSSAAARRFALLHALPGSASSCTSAGSNAHHKLLTTSQTSAPARSAGLAHSCGWQTC